MACSGAMTVEPICDADVIPPAASAAVSAARSRTRNRSAASRAPAETSGGAVPKWLRKAAGSIALMSPRGVVAVTPLEVACRSRTAHRGEEDVMVARVLGDQNDTGDTADGVGVLLEGRVPEILWKVLLAGGEADLWRLRVSREGKRETDFHGRAVGPLGLALEAHRIGDADLRGAEIGHVRNRIGAFQDQERKSLLLFQEQAVERAEQRREPVGAELLRLGDEQLDEEARQLDDMVVRAPGVAVARADREAEPDRDRPRRRDRAPHGRYGEGRGTWSSVGHHPHRRVDQ